MSARTHSTLRTPNGMLVGSSIQTAYDTAAHERNPRNGAAIRRRRRRRPRLAAAPRLSDRLAAAAARVTGAESSGFAATPRTERRPGRRRTLIRTSTALRLSPFAHGFHG